MDKKQKFKSKIDLNDYIFKSKKFEIELGCGNYKKDGRIGVDSVDLNCVDIITDLNEGLFFLPDSCVDAVYTNHFLEHITNLENLINEICRVLKPTGICHNYVPHFSNPHYYSDYTHKVFFGLYTMSYMSSSQNKFKRKVSNHYSNVRLEIVSIRLIFSSVFTPIHYFKKAFQLLVNSHPLCQEIYEENFCWAIPCHGIEIVFKKN